MIKTVNQVAFKLFKSNKYTIFSSILSIALAVMVIITMISLVSNGQQSMTNEIKKKYGDVDLIVGYAPDSGRSMSTSFIDSLTSHQAIQHYSKELITNTLIEDGAVTAYTVGVEQDELSKSRYHYTEVIAHDEVIINETLAQSLAVGVNDKLEIAGATFTIVEVLHNISDTGTAPLMVILPIDTVKQIIYARSGVQNEATNLLVNIKAGADQYALVEHMKIINA